MRLSANIPDDSPLAQAVAHEKATTGRNVSDIIRDALLMRYGLGNFLAPRKDRDGAVPSYEYEFRKED